MNDKDKEAFNKWLNDQDYKYDTWDGQDYRDGKIVSIYSETELAWQAACEYKDKEIGDLKFTFKSLNDDALEIINENKKLREALEKIVDRYFDLPYEVRMKKGLKERKESLIAREALK